MEKKEIVSFLKKAIVMEYNDVFLYNKEKQSAELGDKIKGIFGSLGNQETEHLDIFLMELKKYSEGQIIELLPSVGGKTFREILMYHKGQEDTAVVFYEEFEKMHPDAEFKKKLSKIIVDEKTHLELINKLIRELPAVR